VDLVYTSETLASILAEWLLYQIKVSLILAQKLQVPMFKGIAISIRFSITVLETF